MQLQLYAERGNFNSQNLILRDTYNAKAYDFDSLNALLDRDENRITTIIVSTSLSVIIFSVVIFLLMFCTFCLTESCNQSKWVEKAKNNRPAVTSLAVVSFILNIYIVCLASSAIGFWNEHIEKDAKLSKFFSGIDSQRINLAPMKITLVFDLACIVVYAILAIASLCVAYCYKKYEEYELVILSLTVLCPMLCIIAHSPYIAVAYLNDGDHASSIFIYYTILIYVFFGLLWLFCHWYQHKPHVQDDCVPLLSVNGQTTDKRKKKVVIICAIFAVLALLGLVVVIACYLVLIPINKAISDAPNRILSIYQSGGFLIGSFIVFKVLEYFYSRKPEDKEVTLETINKTLDKYFGSEDDKKQLPMQTLN